VGSQQQYTSLRPPWRECTSLHRVTHTEADMITRNVRMLEIETDVLEMAEIDALASRLSKSLQSLDVKTCCLPNLKQRYPLYLPQWGSLRFLDRPLLLQRAKKYNFNRILLRMRHTLRSFRLTLDPAPLLPRSVFAGGSTGHPSGSPSECIYLFGATASLKTCLPHMKVLEELIVPVQALWRRTQTPVDTFADNSKYFNRLVDGVISSLATYYWSEENAGGHGGLLANTYTPANVAGSWASSASTAATAGSDSSSETSGSSEVSDSSMSSSSSSSRSTNAASKAGKPSANDSTSTLALPPHLQTLEIFDMRQALIKKRHYFCDRMLVSAYTDLLEAVADFIVPADWCGESDFKHREHLPYTFKRLVFELPFRQIPVPMHRLDEIFRLWGDKGAGWYQPERAICGAGEKLGVEVELREGEALKDYPTCRKCKPPSQPGPSSDSQQAAGPA
jgi:hypothetical protein